MSDRVLIKGESHKTHTERALPAKQKGKLTIVYIPFNLYDTAEDTRLISNSNTSLNLYKRDK